jgi:hypothetical protein
MTTANAGGEVVGVGSPAALAIDAAEARPLIDVNRQEGAKLSEKSAD